MKNRPVLYHSPLTQSAAMKPLAPPCSILVLAGGRGRRMGGRDKGLIEWRGMPLIAHLHEHTRALTDDLIISCNRNQDHYRAYADQLVSDAEAGFQGPLAGMLAGLAHARHAQVLILPCDAPHVDATLINDLLAAARRTPQQPLMIRQGEQWQPLFCVLPKSLHPALTTCWSNGERSPKHALLQLNARAYECAAEDPRLSNLNTPELLKAASTHKMD